MGTSNTSAIIHPNLLSLREKSGMPPEAGIFSYF
jgi:hypothetical protein